MSNVPKNTPLEYARASQQDTHLSIWAHADWLSELVQRRIDAIPHDKQELREIRRSSKPPKQAPDTNFAQSMRQLGANLSLADYDKRRRELTEKQLRDEFVGARHRVFARREDDETDSVVELAPAFWPGAKFHSSRSAVSKRGVVFVDVRVVAGSVGAAPTLAIATAAEAQPKPPKAKLKPGPKSKESYIRRAIQEVPSSVPNWKSLNLPRRYRHYMHFLKSKTDADTSLKGFSAKTFEKFEGKMREEVRRQRL
jgi:hypothetical protein